MDSTDTVLKTIMIACFSISAIMIILRTVITFLERYYSSAVGSMWKILVPYTVLVRETIHYTGDTLVRKKINHFPNFRIRYYKHRKWAGLFTGEVVVYVKPDHDIPDLVNTTLHEVMHYIQSRKSRQYKYYDHYSRTLGYWNNPLEVEARTFASDNLEACLEYLESKQIIKRI